MTLERIENIFNGSNLRTDIRHSRVIAEMRQALGGFDIPLPLATNVQGLRYLKQQLAEKGLEPLAEVIDEIIVQRNGRDVNLSTDTIESSRRNTALTQDLVDRLRPVTDLLPDDVHVYDLHASSPNQIPQIAEFRRGIERSESSAIGQAFMRTFWHFRALKGENLNYGPVPQVLVSDYRALDSYLERGLIEESNSTRFVAAVFSPTLTEFKSFR